MKAVLLVVFLLPLAALGDKCSADNCKLDDGCVCSGTQSPLSVGETPQLVILTFDDAVNRFDVEDIYKPLLQGRKNPDGSSISGTFFVPHQYTDYQMVNRLYNLGFEIGSHSISKDGAEHWRNADYQLLLDEFNGQKEILNLHCNLPKEHIRGARIPYLEMRGDEYMKALVDGGFNYDSTWISLSSTKLFPFTLDQDSGVLCHVGECPKGSFPGLWISPINNLKGNSSDCNALHGCNINGTKEEIRDWLNSNFESNLNGNRGPFKLLINKAFFGAYPTGLEALSMFLDDILKNPNVFIVSEWQAINWRKNPVSVADFHPLQETHDAPCYESTCVLQKEGDPIDIYWYTCDDCPDVYPWVGNTEGLL